MLRGYRLLFVALGLALASPSYSQEAKRDQAKPSDNSASKLERIALAVEKLPSAPTPDSGCQPGQDDRQSDLCAQWKAADATAEAARWTLWTFLTSLIGLCVGAGTLAAAWLAARWAKKAADFTETGASAAVEAVAETRRIGEAQVRAYVSLVGIKVAKLDYGLEVRVLSKNTGQSPAFIKSLTYSLHLSNNDKSEKVTTEPMSVGGGMEEYLHAIHFRTREPETAMIVIEVIVVFTDVFGGTYTKRERFAGPARWLKDGTGESFEFRHNLVSAIQVMGESEGCSTPT